MLSEWDDQYALVAIIMVFERLGMIFPRRFNYCSGVFWQSLQGLRSKFFPIYFLLVKRHTHNSLILLTESLMIVWVSAALVTIDYNVVMFERLGIFLWKTVYFSKKIQSLLRCLLALFTGFKVKIRSSLLSCEYSHMCGQILATEEQDVLLYM